MVPEAPGQPPHQVHQAWGPETQEVYSLLSSSALAAFLDAPSNPASYLNISLLSRVSPEHLLRIRPTPIHSSPEDLTYSHIGHHVVAVVEVDKAQVGDVHHE